MSSTERELEPIRAGENRLPPLTALEVQSLIDSLADRARSLLGEADSRRPRSADREPRLCRTVERTARGAN
jgi:hypothetical protein